MSWDHVWASIFNPYVDNHDLDLEVAILKMHRPDKSKMKTAKMRKCLKCEKMFFSGWKGERLCPQCKGLNKARYQDMPEEV